MGSEALEEEIGKALWIWGRRGDGVTGVIGWFRWFFIYLFFWIEQVPNDLTSSNAMAGRAGDCFGGMEIVMTWTLTLMIEDQAQVQISGWTLQL